MAEECLSMQQVFSVIDHVVWYFGDILPLSLIPDNLFMATVIRLAPQVFEKVSKSQPPISHNKLLA